ncbi:MAG: uroporphyrinogen-III C-methyltransferase [Verrucomicrobiae bacterium]|nr:uroporphyrinogen-III C-methyltransferase [Verrucomicrobiae bacterium]
MNGEMGTRLGKVYLVGAGPGDPGLITVRGVECLQRAEVVVYDKLANPVLLQYAPASAERIYAGKDPQKHTLTQEEINQLLIDRARAGRTVVRLKGGDPVVFGRGSEEAEALRAAGIEYELVPGVSSAIAGPMYAGIPVTHRGLATAFLVVTGHEDPTKESPQVDWEQVARFFGTRVILMGVERIGAIASELMRHGLAADTPVAMVQDATLPRQRVVTGTLATIAEVAEREQIRPPAITVVGDVVRLREVLAWWERRPLYGKRIAVTRSREQASELVRRLSELGADVLEVPTIAIKPPISKAPLREALDGLGEYDWIVFTSPNGVTAFFDEFFRMFDDIRALGHVRIAAVGPATAKKVRALRLRVDLQPQEYTTEALLETFRREVSCENVKFLLPRADLADQRLARGLEDLGAIVDDIDAYRTVPAAEDISGHRARLMAEGADIVTFTSSSTVENFCRLVNVPALQQQFPSMRFVSIGPQTTRAAQEHGLVVAREANPHTIDGLVEAILKL